MSRERMRLVTIPKTDLQMLTEEVRNNMIAQGIPCAMTDAAYLRKEQERITNSSKSDTKSERKSSIRKMLISYFVHKNAPQTLFVFFMLKLV